MKENLVSLAKLLATDDAFNLAFSSRGTDEEKYELAKTKFTDFAREDFLEFLEKLRETEEANLANLSPDELEMVAGGAGSWSTKLAAATMLVTTLGAAGVMSQQADAMKGRHTGTTTQPTQPGMHPFIQNQAPARDLNIIKLGPPRSGKVSYDFTHGEQTAQKIVEKHHNLNLAVGSSSLIGELAQIVESLLWERRALPEEARGEPIKLGGITFKFGRNDDIVADNCGSYKDLIGSMVSSGLATRINAEQILKNLSKPCKPPKNVTGTKKQSGGTDYPFAYFSAIQNPDFNFESIEELSNDLFENLDEESKKFVAVLLCESIRFNDDGAFARWSIREIIGNCKDKELGKSYIEYKKEYTTTQTDEGIDISAIAPFASKGGKAITTNLIYNEPARKVNGSIKKAKEKLEYTKEKMEKHKQYVSPPISPRKDGASLDEDNPTMMDTQEENLLDEPSAILPPAPHEEEEQEEKMSED